MPPLLSITAHFFLQVAVILLTYRLLWPLFRRLAQVQVVAIMVAGFLLGPSVLGWIWPAAQQWLFPTKLTVGAASSRRYRAGLRRGFTQPRAKADKLAHHQAHAEQQRYRDNDDGGHTVTSFRRQWPDVQPQFIA